MNVFQRHVKKTKTHINNRSTTRPSSCCSTVSGSDTDNSELKSSNLNYSYQSQVENSTQPKQEEFNNTNNIISFTRYCKTNKLNMVKLVSALMTGYVLYSQCSPNSHFDMVGYNVNREHYDHHEVFNAENEINANSPIKYAKVKMNMGPYFDAMTENKNVIFDDMETNNANGHNNKLMKSQTTKKNTSPMLTQLSKSVKGLNTLEYDGAVEWELPSINQNMCGSCWAVASSMALKANLKLKNFNMKKHEIPNLTHMVSCSDKIHQIVNNQNMERKWLIELSPTRQVNAGCEGGITGMALSMIQLENNIYIDSVEDYKSGLMGHLGTGPVSRDTSYNIPYMTCSRFHKDKKPLDIDIKIRNLDLLHLHRRNKSNGVHFPSTRDLREFIIEHGSAIVYVDIDSGIDNNKFNNKDVDIANLPVCKWKPSDYIQSGADDMHSVSQFKEADHAMLVVGWSCERKAWLVQNSWGKEWGHEGKMYFYDENVCDEKFVHSAHSNGAGPGCMFGSSISVFRSPQE